MTDLTEKWKAGKLRQGAYYIKIVDVVFIDFFNAKTLKFIRFKEKYIDEVLAPVPTYEELQALKEENARLKGLLKECKNCIEDYPIFGIGSEQKAKEKQELLTKINEVLR